MPDTLTAAEKAAMSAYARKHGGVVADTPDGLTPTEIAAMERYAAKSGGQVATVTAQPYSDRILSLAADAKMAPSVYVARARASAKVQGRHDPFPEVKGADTTPVVSMGKRVRDAQAEGDNAPDRAYQKSVTDSALSVIPGPVKTAASDAGNLAKGIVPSIVEGARTLHDAERIRNQRLQEDAVGIPGRTPSNTPEEIKAGALMATPLTAPFGGAVYKALLDPASMIGNQKGDPLDLLLNENRAQFALDAITLGHGVGKVGGVVAKAADRALLPGDVAAVAGKMRETGAPTGKPTTGNPYDPVAVDIRPKGVIAKTRIPDTADQDLHDALDQATATPGNPYTTIELSGGKVDVNLADRAVMDAVRNTPKPGVAPEVRPPIVPDLGPEKPTKAPAGATHGVDQPRQPDGTYQPYPEQADPSPVATEAPAEAPPAPPVEPVQPPAETTAPEAPAPEVQSVAAPKKATPGVYRDRRPPLTYGGDSAPMADAPATELTNGSDAAKARIAERNKGRLNSGVDPADIVDLAIIGAHKIASGLNTVATWGKSMIADFGDKVRPHLQTVWDQAHAHLGALRLGEGVGMNGGKPVSDMLTAVAARSAQMAKAMITPKDPTAPKPVTLLTPGGRFRNSYGLNKMVGDKMNTAAASRTRGRTYGEFVTRNVTKGLNDKEKSDMMEYLLDQRRRGFDVQGYTGYNPDSLPNLTDAESRAIASNPKIKAALIKHEAGPQQVIQGYRQYVSPGMTIQTTPSGHFISLEAVKDAKGNVIGQEPLGVGGSAASRQRVRGTRYAKQATGTAAEYSRDYGNSIKKNIEEIFHNADKKDLIQSILAQKDSNGNALGYTNALGGHLPSEIMWEGKKYPAKVIEYQLKPSGSKGAPMLKIAVPEPIWKDYNDVTLPKPEPGPLEKGLQGAAGTATTAMLALPAELFRHVNRLIGVISALPDVTAPEGARVAGLLPLVAKPQSFLKLVTQDFSDPATMKVYQDIVDANGGSDRAFQGEITNSWVGKLPGVKQTTAFTHDQLFGLPEGKGFKGFDIRLRVYAEKIRREVEGNADPQRIRDFGNQFGQYTSAPDKGIALIRKINPFAGTSLPVRWTEVKQLVGDAGFKNLTAEQKLRLRAEIIVKKYSATLITAAYINHQLSGHWPWENADGHKTDIEVGTDTDGKPIYYGGATAMPEVSRPLRDTGIISAAQGATGDNDPARNAKNAASGVRRDLVNAGMDTVNSPALQAAATAATGRSLYLTKGNDLMHSSSPTDSGDAFDQGIENLKSGIGGINPLAGKLTGTYHSTQDSIDAPFWKQVQISEALLGPIMKKDITKGHQDRPARPGRLHRPKR